MSTDLKQFSALKAHMEKIAAERKTTKTKLDEIQKVAVQAMLQVNKRYIDESGNGSGPFWTLCKDPKEGNWKADRYHEFFTWVLTKQQQGERFTPEKLTASAQQFLKQYEKRDLKIEKHTTARGKTCEDLVHWLANGSVDGQ